MSDIAEFITARLNEDEEVAKTVVTAARADIREPWPPEQAPGRGGPALTQFLRTFNEHRMLADIAAKRRILDDHADINDGDCSTCVRGRWGYPTHGGADIERWPCPTIRALASAWSDHPRLPARMDSYSIN